MYAVDADEPTRSAFRCVDNAVNTATARTRYKHFYDGECRYRLLPTPAPRLRDKCTSGSNVSLRPIAAKLFLLNHKAALEPSDPVALTHWQTHATPMVPRAGAHDEPASRQDATVGVGAAVCDCTAMDPHRFWTNCGSP